MAAKLNTVLVMLQHHLCAFQPTFATMGFITHKTSAILSEFLKKWSGSFSYVDKLAVNLMFLQNESFELEH